MLKRSVNRLIDSVIAMQRGKNGVKGPAQNSRQADAITNAQFQSNSAWSRYPTHTGEYTTAITSIRRRKVFTSLHSCHTQRQKRTILSLSFEIISILPLCHTRCNSIALTNFGTAKPCNAHGISLQVRRKLPVRQNYPKRWPRNRSFMILRFRGNYKAEYKMFTICY